MLVPSNSLRESLTLATARYEASLDIAGSYLTTRGFSKDSAQYFRLGVVREPIPEHEAYEGRLAIPYITKAGITTIRFRCLRDHNCKEAGCSKYLGLPGHDPRLYNVNDLFLHDDVLVLCEGEIDAMTFHLAGFAAVGYPGIDTWTSAMTRAVRGFADTIVVADGDKQGRTAAKQLAREVSGRVVKMPDDEDGNSYAMKHGLDSLKLILL